MKHRTLTVIALAFGIAPMLGCATIMKGGDQKMAFRGDPSGARISVFDSRGTLVTDGKTPVTLPLKKGDGYFQAARYKVVFEAPGYAKKEIWLSGSLEAGWYIAGNLVVGGLIGWLIVDPITGAMWNLGPEAVGANLDPLVSSTTDGALHVVLLGEVPPDILAAASLVATAP